MLGHLTENGRIIGLLLENIDGTFASSENLMDCERTLRSLHGIGLIHGDVNRYNFLVDTSSSKVKMVDFEYAEGFEQTTARLELESLSSELSEQTGRGGPAIAI